LYDLAERKAAGTCVETTFREYVERRTHHEPLAYIAGEGEFMGQMFQVADGAKRVLIPREDTEVLVQTAAQGALEDMGAMSARDMYSIVELGCGSGAILLSLLRQLQKQHAAVRGLGIDCSQDAVELSRMNAGTFLWERDARRPEVEFRLGDWLKLVDMSVVNMIISNPPYISQQEFNALDSSVKEFEPAGALLADGEGLQHYKTIARQVEELANPCRFRRLVVEVGHKQAEDVATVFRGAFKRLSIATAI